MASRSLRLFVAIALPPEVKARLGEALLDVRRLAPDAKIPPAENLHLTLRFLGNTPLEELAAVEDALALAAHRARAGRGFVRGAGSFGRSARPSVLYASVVGADDELAALTRAVCDALAREPDERFTPHITLARARPRGGDAGLARAREALALVDGGALPVAALTLFESQTASSGSRYRVVGEWPLRLDGAPA